MFTKVHVSLFGQYIELAPLFAIPFMVLMNLYGPKHWSYPMMLLACLHILFILMIIVVHRILKKTAFNVFKCFIYSEHSERIFTNFSLLKPSSSIRFIAEYNSDPFVLKKFMDYEKQTHLRTSCFIEICRFLALFPEYRYLMLTEIQNVASRSTYNKFILFMLRHILQSITDEKIPDKAINQIEYFKTSYIAHSYLYWNSRKNKNYIRTFFESFYCAYLANEEKNYIHSLVQIYPTDPLLHKYFGELLLNIDGKFEAYKKEIMFSVELQKNKSAVFDPFLRTMALNNPKILQYCNTGVQLSIYNSNSSDLTSNMSSSIFKKKFKKEKNKKNKNIASKIVRSERKIPYLHVLHFILPAIFVFSFNLYSDFMSNKDFRMSKPLISLIASIEQSFNVIASSVFIPLAIKDSKINSTNNEIQCQKNFVKMTNAVSEYINTPIISNFNDYIVNIIFHEIKRLVLVSKDVCDIVNNIPDFLKDRVYDNMAKIIDQKNLFNNNFENIYENEKALYNITKFIKYGSIIVLLFIVIYFIANCISINTIMSKNHDAIEFLSSENRLIQIFQKPELRGNLWYNCSALESSVNNSDSSFHLEYESELDTTSFLSPSTFSKSRYQISKQLRDQRKSSNFRPTSSATHLLRPQLISPSKIALNENEQEDSNNRQRISLSKSAVSGSVTSLMSRKNMIPRPSASPSPSPSPISSPRKNKTETDDSILSDTFNIDINQNESLKISNPESLQTTTDDSNSDLRINLEQINSEDYASAIQIINDNAISEFLETKKKDTFSFGFYSILIIILFPWILFYILISLSFYPLKNRRKSDLQLIDKIRLLTNDFDNAFLLLNETLNLFYFQEANFSKFREINQTFSLRLTEFADLYFDVQCFEFSSTECYSINSIVQQLIDNNFNDGFMEVFAIPLLANYTRYSIEILYLGNSQKLFQSSSPSISFLFLSFFLLVVFIAVGFVKSKTLKLGINSLFHFPGKDNNFVQGSQKTLTTSTSVTNTNQQLKSSTESQLNTTNTTTNTSTDLILNLKNINNNNDNNNNSNESQVFDTNNSSAISATAGNFNNTNNINSIEGQNLTIKERPNKNLEKRKDSIIGQQSSISNKLKNFPSNVIIVTSVTETDEIYSLSDTCIQIINKYPSELICKKMSRIFPVTKKTDEFEIREHNGRTFISKTKIIGKLTKTVLFESLKYEPKNKTTNTIQKLINFMPLYFVKPFSEEFVNYFHFDESILIFIRINPKVTQIENFFTIINRLDQSFYDIDFIRSNGSVLTFICKQHDALEIVLFLRDLITSSEESCKKQMNNFALKSIYICSIDELNIEINEGDIEPEIYFEEKEFYDQETRIYYVNDNAIGCSEYVYSLLCSIGNYQKVVSSNNICMIQFTDFKDEIGNIL